MDVDPLPANGYFRDNTGYILVIEKDSVLRERVSRTLEDAGYQVLLAPTGQAGSYLLRYAQPALIILDLDRPNGAAEEFLERYRQAPGPHAPFLVTTGCAEAARRAAELGAAAYLIKPFSPAALRRIVTRHLPPVPGRG